MLEATDPPVTTDGRRCFEQFGGQARPCPDCPLLQDDDRPYVIRRQGGTFEVLQAERTTHARAVVSRLCIDDALLADIQRVQLRAIAEAAHLTEREVIVLEALVRGEELSDIAHALAIAVRTVKFHQANLFRKLGVESRNTLMRRIWARAISGG